MLASHFVLLVLVALGGCAAPADRLPDVKVTTEDGMRLSDADLATILALARRVGLGEIESVRGGIVARPGHALGVTVTERPSLADATRADRRQLNMLRVASGCSTTYGPSPILVDGWVTSVSWVNVRALRRFHVDARTIDLPVADAVPYEDAARMIAALFEPHFDRRSGVFGWKPEEIVWIGPASGGDPARTGHAGSGHALHAVLVSGRLLLLCVEPDDVVLVESQPYRLRV